MCLFVLTKGLKMSTVERKGGKKMALKEESLKKAFTYLESGPVVLVTTKNGEKENVMTISWHMVLDFTPKIALCTGDWNDSFKTLKEIKECTICVPAVDMIEKVIGIGTKHSWEMDKIKEYKIKTLKGKIVKAPLIANCVCCIECKLENYIQKENILIFSAVKLWVNKGKKEKRLVHAIGDGTFVVDGVKLNYRKEMAGRLP